MIETFKAIRRHKADKQKYDAWVEKFSEQIRKCTGNDDSAVAAELESWPFETNDTLYSWRLEDPVDAALEALSYYGD
ncbi:hypothetical protein JY459_20535 [Serratia marcescens]|nr:hypothetical protein [Serratia marcescens]